MIKVAVIGIGGYTGEELLKIVARHPAARIASACARGGLAGKKIRDIYPALGLPGDVVCETPDAAKIAAECETAFLALPHGEAAPFAADILAGGAKVIDLSADFRLKSPELYERWYKLRHPKPGLLAEAVYGLPEINREKIKNAKLVANPGCYPTTVLLALAPLFMRIPAECDFSSIIADSKSGVSGGGRKFAAQYFEKDHPDHKPYNIAGVHRHIPEMEQELSLWSGSDIKITFTPSIIPVERGMLSTIYVDLRGDFTDSGLTELYKEFYKDAKFVKIHDADKLPSVKNVVGTNFCEIGVRFDARTRRAVIVSAIDNLVKGAAGQAVENFNIMHAIDETAGIL